ncbi:DegT/DnrJ/EryC1/StrS family aminotransferase [Akkermansiaceae bacterium]|nr:DegT/DnrJ/EryC1/StrS family aminotransferase [Akkermansiaceae bacterium]
MIPVTKPFLPPSEDYLKYLDGIWKRQWLTNMGPLSEDLEKKLKTNLGVKNLLFVSSGTIALQLAIKALDLKGEIITTPFTYVATTSSIVWEGCIPVYVDIDKNSLNIDPSKIEAAITENTSAILATHVYGNPCDVEAIKKIADKYNLKVIYDAAHAFGVKVDGKSIFEYGDVSTCSTHATKLFHTVEGGFVVTKKRSLSDQVRSMRNFGHEGPEGFHGLGINGKNSEFHAAMGLANLEYTSDIYQQRKKLTERYDKNLKNLTVAKPFWHDKTSSNFAYYPLVFQRKETLLKTIKLLTANEIFGRRYFFPSLPAALPYVKSVSLKNTDDISKRIFCLPLYCDLSLGDVDMICSLILDINNQ